MKKQFGRDDGNTERHRGRKLTISTVFEQPRRDDPKNWPSRKRHLILYIVTFAEGLTPLANTIFYPSIIDIRADLKTSDIMVNTLFGVYIIFWGIVSFFWAQYSNTYGIRRNIYLTSFTLFICASVISAISVNVWILIAMRILQACGASSAIGVGVGVLSDIFGQEERGFAFGMYFAGYCFGDLAGPVIGGYIDKYFGWRCINWFLAIFVAFILLLIFIFVPETHRLQSAPSPEFFPPHPLSPPVRIPFNPLKPLRLLTYPNVFLMVTYISIIIMILFFQNISIPVPFTNTYNLPTHLVGLVYLLPGFGNVFGCVIGGQYSDYMMYVSRERGEDGNMVGIPEKRINSVWIAAVLIPASYVAFGWALETKIHISVPLIALFTGGFSVNIVFSSAIAYLCDAYAPHNASIMSVSDSMAFILSGIMTVVASSLLNSLGYGWMFTILAGASIYGMILSVIVYFKGRGWRERQNERW